MKSYKLNVENNGGSRVLSLDTSDPFIIDSVLEIIAISDNRKEGTQIKECHRYIPPGSRPPDSKPNLANLTRVVEWGFER